jgi:hypothetical protein
MGADSFIVYYGIRWEVSDEAEIESLELKKDSRIKLAKQHKLNLWWGVTTDQERYFLLIGTELGSFGWEGASNRSISDIEVRDVVKGTIGKLKDAGFKENPAFHFQFEPDY